MKKQKFDIEQFCEKYNLDRKDTAKLLKLKLKPPYTPKTLAEAKLICASVTATEEEKLAAAEVWYRLSTSFEELYDLFELLGACGLSNDFASYDAATEKEFGLFLKEAKEATSIQKIKHLMQLLSNVSSEDHAMVGLSCWFKLTKTKQDLEEFLVGRSDWNEKKIKPLFDSAVKKLAALHGYKA